MKASSNVGSGAYKAAGASRCMRLASVGLWVFALALAMQARTASAVLVNGAMQTDLRPIVSISFSTTNDGGTGPGAGTTAVGIFDSGDPNDTLSRETASRLGLAPNPPLNPTANPAVGARPPQNRGTTALFTNITSGGWFGGTFQGPERNSVAVAADPQVRAGDPGHVFTNAVTTRTAPITVNNLSPYYEDYNSAVSVNLMGDAYTAQANPANNYSVFIDPLNASPLPFRFDNQNAGNGKGLGFAGGAALNTSASSVTYLAPGNSRIPNPTINADPGFVTFVPLIPMDYAPGSLLTPQPVGAANPNVTVNAALPAGTNRLLTLTVSNANAPNVTQIVPATGAESAGTVPAGFGQLDPGYVPWNNATSSIVPVTAWSLQVKSAAIANAGQENPNGFVRSTGTVQVDVRQVAANALVRTDTVYLPDQAPLTFGNIVIPSLGIDTTANGGGPAFGPTLIDTGAPTTTNGSIIGTDILNQFGQVWNYAPSNLDPANPNRGLLTLIGPTQPSIIALRANGILMNVSSGTTGLVSTGVNQLATYGAVPQLQTSPAAPTNGDNIAGQQAQTDFKTSLTGSNADFISAQALGLVPGGPVQMLGQSLGGETIAKNSLLYFGVSLTSTGLPGTDVNGQSLRGQQASDIYSAAPRAGGGALRVGNQPNKLVINQEVLGLGPNVGPGAFVPLPQQSSDDMKDFVLNTQNALPAAGALSNLDSPVTAPAGDRGTASRPRVGTDTLGTNYDLYFTTNSSSSIFRDSVATTFATAANIGLATGDRIAALSLFRPSVSPGVRGGNLQPGYALVSTNLSENADADATYDPNTDDNFDGIDSFHGLAPTDLALFTLTPNSPDVTFGVVSSAADVFITDFDGTFALYATSQSMGLSPTDAIDGLKSVAIPEPGALGLLLAGAAGLLRKRKRK